jgi:hypothetical protein
MTKHMILTETEVPNPAGDATYAAKWIRLPTRGRCPHTGLSRAAYYELIKANRIRTANLKRPGALRGTRLVWLPSIMTFLDRFATGGVEQ